jgi:hypothetical protein
MIYAVVHCPVSFSANGYSDYVHSCCAVQLTLCTRYALMCYVYATKYCPVSSVQPAILTYYVFTVDVAMPLTLCFCTH